MTLYEYWLLYKDRHSESSIVQETLERTLNSMTIEEATRLA